SKPIKIGVIAEEENVVEVLYELTCKLIRENAFSFTRFIGHGCGKLRNKCRAWAAALVRRGCTHLMVSHDCDGGEPNALRALLEAEVKDSGSRFAIILIPVEELEAWLLADPDALQTVFRMQRRPKVPATPERLPDPKKFLERLGAKNSKSQYL